MLCQGRSCFLLEGRETLWILSGGGAAASVGRLLMRPGRCPTEKSHLMASEFRYQRHTCHACPTHLRCRDVLPPAFEGGPSVIPFGVGEGRLESGVVQIPLRFTVGQTVDFIRTIATVDRDYRREKEQPEASTTQGAVEPGIAVEVGGKDAAVAAEEMG